MKKLIIVILLIEVLALVNACASKPFKMSCTPNGYNTKGRCNTPIFTDAVTGERL